MLGVLAGACLMLGSALDWSGVAYSSTLDRTLVFASGAFLLLIVAAARLRQPRALVLSLVPGSSG